MATSTVGEVKRILGAFNKEYGASLSAVISRAGMPIAWVMPGDVHLENFATLAATLVGSCEVIYTGLGKPAPRRVIVDSPDGTLVATGLGAKAFLVAMTPALSEQFLEGIEGISDDLREVLQAQR